MSWFNLRHGEQDEDFAQEDKDDIADARLDWDSEGSFGDDGPEDDDE